MELATECTHLWFPSIPNPTRLFLVGHGPPTEYSWLKVRTTNNGGDGFGIGSNLVRMGVGCLVAALLRSLVLRGWVWGCYRYGKQAIRNGLHYSMWSYFYSSALSSYQNPDKTWWPLKNHIAGNTLQLYRGVYTYIIASDLNLKHIILGDLNQNHKFTNTITDPHDCFVIPWSIHCYRLVITGAPDCSKIGVTISPALRSCY